MPYNVEGPSHIAGIIAHAMCVTRIAMLAGTGNQVSSNRAMQYGAKYSHDQGDIFGQAVSSSRKKQIQQLSVELEKTAIEVRNTEKQSFK